MSGLFLFVISFWNSLFEMPLANRLLSYEGRLTSARTSPVCGFITMNTPRLRPAAFMPHLRACVASFWIVLSIVSVSEAPGTASWTVWRTWTSRPVASRSTSSMP